MTGSLFEKLNVLAIDDESFSRNFVARVLEAVGVGNAIMAKSGAEAFEILESDETTFDLIICDIEMPEMTGYEFVRKIRYGTVPQYKDIPVIILTGKDTDKNIRSARIHKISDFLIKPPTADSLSDSIRRVLFD